MTAAATPGGRPVPLGTRKLELAQQNQRAATRSIAIARFANYLRPTPHQSPTLSGRIYLFPLPRSSRGGSYFL